MAVKIQKLFEELILIILILLNVFEILNLLPGDVSFLKSVLSIAGVAYLLYKASFSDIFFGQKDMKLDSLLIFSYMLLIINKFVQISYSTYEEAAVMQDLLIFIIENSVFLEKVGFFLGIFLFVLISAYVALKVQIRGPSIMDALHGEKIHGFVKRFGTIFVIVAGFYLIFFNLIIEWFTVVIDTPLVVLAIFVYMFKIHDVGKTMDEEEFLFKISAFAETFLERFVELFHSKSTIFLGISGLLVLHVLNDIGAFILPYTIGLETVYHQSLGAGHETLMNLFMADVSNLTPLLDRSLIAAGYLMNTFGLIMLMLGPGFIWYILYMSNKDKNSGQMVFPDFVMALFFFFLAFVILAPVFKLEAISAESNKDLVGVDIKTQSIQDTKIPLAWVFGLSFSLLLLITIFTKFPMVKNMIFYIMTFLILGFFGIYIFFYFSSLVQNYMSFINELLSALPTMGLSLDSIGMAVMLMVYMIFLMILVVFYLGGYISFLSDIFKKE